MPGKVYLVGAGIGNKDYLTVKAKKLIAIAEVLIYDALVDTDLLDLAPEDCLKLDVGKRGGKLSTPQEKINQLLIAYCDRGCRVVRLKSGDPFVFGRANEEIDALKTANCDVEIVSGISSALAAPLLAGIPLTDKNLSRCFTVLSGHQPEQLDWNALTRIDTLVILMGGRSLSKIVGYLQDNGRNINEPVAIVRNCGRESQEIFRGTLADIVEKTTGVALSPAVIIIGEVVALSDINNSNKIAERNKPLAQKTILVTRAVEQSSKFTALLKQQGAIVLEMPALEITAPSSWNDLDNAIASIEKFHWLILTSANGVNYLCDRLKTLGRDWRVLGNLKIAVVGKKTATVLQQKHLNPDFIPPDFVADSLVENFPESLQDKNILFPRVETGGRAILVKELTARGANITEVAAYESKCPKTIDIKAWAALQSKRIDAIAFASSKTVGNFYQLIQQQLKSETSINDILDRVAIASIGPQTSKTCLELFGRVDIEAKEYTLEGLTTAIAEQMK